VDQRARAEVPTLQHLVWVDTEWEDFLAVAGTGHSTEPDWVYPFGNP
jgi:hypothetical protein